MQLGSPSHGLSHGLSTPGEALCLADGGVRCGGKSPWCLLEQQTTPAAPSSLYNLHQEVEKQENLVRTSDIEGGPCTHTGSVRVRSARAVRRTLSLGSP